MARRDDIVKAQTEALKQKQTERLSTIRLLFAAIRGAEIDAGKMLDDTLIEEVVRRQIKQLKDAAKEYASGNRPDLEAGALREIEVLREFVPPELSEAELEAIIDSVIASNGPTQTKDMGKIMGLVMKEIGGRGDGALVRTRIQAKLV